MARHFNGLVGLKPSRSLSLNWSELDYPRLDLVDLESDITIDEIKQAISEMPKENTPGPDGFIGAFYCTCWDVIKSDVCQNVW
jgi:hypothetical protein